MTVSVVPGSGQMGLSDQSSTAIGDTYSYKFSELAALVHRQLPVFLSIVGSLLLICLLYCLIAPNEYDATAKVALRMQSASSLSLETVDAIAPASILSTPLQLETLVNVLRSERLEWHVITKLRLYESPAFSRTFIHRFPGFKAETPGSEAQSYLLELFARRLNVRTLPRTLLLEIRFRSKDPALAANVVNTLIQSYMEQESDARKDSTAQASLWLQGQLSTLSAQTVEDDKRLSDFERLHDFLTTQQTSASGQPVELLHQTVTSQVDEAGRQLSAAIGDRILREALYREAQLGNPEQVLAANPDLQAEMGPGGATVARELRIRQSEIRTEMAQLRVEHGVKFPRVVELQRALEEIEAQLKAEDINLLEAFRRTWKTASDRELLLKRQLDERTADGIRMNDATVEYAVLHEQVVSGRELSSRLRRRIQEAGLAAGVHAASITVVDSAREPFKAATPNLPLYMAITLAVSVWLGLGAAFWMDAIRRPLAQVQKLGVVLVVLVAVGGSAWAQAPTPNTSGLPSGVVKLAKDTPSAGQPDPQKAPQAWNTSAVTPTQQALDGGLRAGATPMALPIAGGDSLDVSEFHMPEFRSAVRVSMLGTIVLPLVGEVKLSGLTESEASRVIEKALLAGGMLMHPQVSVLVTNAAGQDVSVLGEVARPGVYAFTVHHRLLDLISAASGLSQNAGRLVSISHRDDPHAVQAVVLDPSGTAAGGPSTAVDHNPELSPGDTVQVSRAGLVYVIGDVVRPGGFAVDPVQGLTVVQAVSLAWGATPNASVSRAILIHDQSGGRTLTTLNLQRMIRGQDPDQPVRDRDILFIPDSATKNLLSKTLESAIQSVIGVSIYAGLVYSQRF